MRWTDLRTGYACSLTCRFCDQGDARTRLGNADTAAVIAALRSVPHREGVAFAGGEVTERSDLVTLVSEARTLGFRRVALQSNGQVLAAPGAAASLRKAGLTDLALSLHAPEASVHDWITQTPGSHRRVLAAARHAVAAGLGVRLLCTLTRTSTPLASRLVALAARLGARAVRFTLCREEGAAELDARQLAPRLSLVSEALVPALTVARELGVELETVGLPLCMAPELRAVAADRRDSPEPERAFALAEAAPREARSYAAECSRCPLQPACPGVEAAYLRRWGSAELRAPGQPPAAPPEVASVEVHPGDPTRTLRQRVVQARSSGSLRYRFVGAGASTHPELDAIRKECDRLGMTEA